MTTTVFVPEMVKLNTTEGSNCQEKFDMNNVNIKYADTNGDNVEFKGNDKTQWKVSFKDFCQNTTLHGVNKIVEDTPFTARRVIWVIIVLGSMALFGLQLVQNILTYMSRPVTVNVKINYNNTLIFPSVTICNQNDFRTTAAAAMGRYHMVRDFYRNLNHGGINLTEYNATGLDLQDLYSFAAHQKHDLIVGCEWIQQTCDIEEDFDLTVTDYGYCYTFNSGQSGSSLRNVSNTGADRGLKLTLNLEQYEYMKGPNPGAGIKLLIHDNTDVPLVRDLGQAIPPGSHAFAGIQIVKVNNLKPPHGKCNDSTELDFYDRYSVSACMIECKEKFIISRCGCRDVYMPVNESGFPPVCTLEQYQSCFVQKSELFNQQQDPCECPVPCHRTMYDPTITYASISNYDTDIFLRGDSYIDSLRSRYRHARETSDRVNEQAVDDHIRLFTHFNKTLEALTEMVFVHYRSDLQVIFNTISSSRSEFQQRRLFHMYWGLKKLLYVAEHNFIRGWDVVNERTFIHVTSYYQDTVEYLHYALPKIANISEDLALRQALYVQADSKLYQHRSLAMRAKSNMSTVYEAYKNCIPLQKYKVSPKYRYDLSYITPTIIKYDDDDIDANMQKIDLRLTELVSQSDALRSILRSALDDAEADMDEFQDVAKDFEYRSRSYNYYKFLIKSRVIDIPQEISQGLIDKFEKVYDEVMSEILELERFVNDTISILDEADMKWHLLKHLRNEAFDYLHNTSRTKTDLAKLGTSDAVAQSLNQIRAFFEDLRSRSDQISLSLMRSQYEAYQLYEAFVKEETLHPFYEKLKQDIDTILYQNISEIQYNKLVGIIKYMLNAAYGWSLNADDVPIMDDDLFKLTNADFVITNHSSGLENISNTFSQLQSISSEQDFISEEEDFVGAFNDLHQVLYNYLEINKVDGKFFRENFMEVDVFMKELSYEEIDQQIAYDMTNLWSDIGGSLGLFIGASVVTVLELCDFLMLKVIYLSGTKRKPTHV